MGKYDGEGEDIKLNITTHIEPRKALGKIKSYTPGKPIWEVQKELKQNRVIKLASNENPLGPSPKAMEAISDSLAEINRYPDAHATILRRAIASSYSISPNQIIIGNGADELITLISETFLEPGDEIIVPSPTFSEYEFGANLMCGSVVEAPLDENYQFDIDVILSYITERTKIVYICSPNNPTGTYLPKNHLKHLLDSLPKRVLVVFDGAYSHFATAADYTDGMEYVNAGYPIMVLQTFSKIYGLAGIRVGFGAAPESIVQAISKVKEPFNVNALAQAGAAAAITDKDHIKASKEVNKTGLEQLYKEFSRLGLRYIESMSNFILVEIGKDAKYVYKELLSKGIIVRYGDTWGLPGHIRISIGTFEENTILAEELQAILFEGRKGEFE